MSTLGAALSTPPLTVPTKRAEPFDWIGSLRRILKESGLDPEQFVAEMREFEQARARCLGCGADRVGAQLHIRYYQQLCHLTTRFVTCDSQESTFSWHDAYNSQVKAEQGAVAFEKANILFNLGAILSQMAAARPTATTDDLRGVFNEFQAAASVLHFVKETFLHAPLSDLSKASLEFLVQLMLAQGQEAASRKASLQHPKLLCEPGDEAPEMAAGTAAGTANNGKLPGSSTTEKEGTSAKLLARLWHSTAVHYATALKYWYAPNAAHLRETVQATVPQLIDQKFKLATCLSLLFSAKWAWGENRVGEALARVDAALAICARETAAGENGPDQEGAVAGPFGILQESFLGKMRQRIDRENSLIFHQPIPSVLGELEPAGLATMQPLAAAFKTVMSHEEEEGEEREIFCRAVPKHVRGEAGRFREEVDKLVNYEGHLLEELEREFKGLTERISSLSSSSLGEGSLGRQEFDRRIGVRAQQLVKEPSIEHLHSTSTRLQEVIRAELELNGEKLKSLSKDLFDSHLVKTEQRRALLERIDILSAVYESFCTDIGELKGEPIGEDHVKMSQRISEYSNGDYGYSFATKDTASTSHLKLPSLPSTGEFLEKARKALEGLKETARAADITNDLVKARGSQVNHVIQDALRTFDPLAAEVEMAIAEAKKTLERHISELDEVIAEQQSNPGYQELQEQIRKRSILLDLYGAELTRRQQFLSRVQKIKGDMDGYRREFADIDQQVKSLAQQSVTLHQPRDEFSPPDKDQGVKDRDYLLSRLRQLGIEEEINKAASGSDRLF